MFLKHLDLEEKQAFLKIAHHFARSDGEFSQAEQATIAEYCTEMQIDDIAYDEKNFVLSEILQVFKSSKHQKIVLLETMALAMADELVYIDSLHLKEKNIIEEMLKAFKLSAQIVPIYAEWTKAILALSMQGQALIEL